MKDYGYNSWSDERKIIFNSNVYRDMPIETYEQRMAKRNMYYLSQDWSTKKYFVHKRSKGICETPSCQNVARHCHHKTYDNLYNEDINIDLIDLCIECHDLAHGKKSNNSKKWDSSCVEKFKLVKDFLNEQGKLSTYGIKEEH